MRIGIDLDDVVFEFVRKFLELYGKKNGKKIEFEDVYTYDFTKILNVELDEVLIMISKMNEVGKFIELDLCPEVHDSIIQLAEENDIYFITSRVYREGTMDSLMKYFSGINFELIFSSNPYAKTEGKNKGVICKEFGIDFMVEDSYEHSKDCINEGVSVFLIDKPWNRNYSEYFGMKKVKGWNEIIKTIKESKK